MLKQTQVIKVYFFILQLITQKSPFSLTEEMGFCYTTTLLHGKKALRCSVVLPVCEKIGIKISARKSNGAVTGDIMSLPYCGVKTFGYLTAPMLQVETSMILNEWWEVQLPETSTPTPWEIKQGADRESKVHPPYNYSVTFCAVEEVIFHGGTQVPLLKHTRGEPVIRTNCGFWVKWPSELIVTAMILMRIKGCCSIYEIPNAVHMFDDSAADI